MSDQDYDELSRRLLELGQSVQGARSLVEGLRRLERANKLTLPPPEQTLEQLLDGTLRFETTLKCCNIEVDLERIIPANMRQVVAHVCVMSMQMPRPSKGARDRYIGTHTSVPAWFGGTCPECKQNFDLQIKFGVRISNSDLKRFQVPDGLRKEILARVNSSEAARVRESLLRKGVPCLTTGCDAIIPWDPPGTPSREQRDMTHCPKCKERFK